MQRENTEKSKSTGHQYNKGAGMVKEMYIWVWNRLNECVVTCESPQYNIMETEHTKQHSSSQVIIYSDA